LTSYLATPRWSPRVGALLAPLAPRHDPEWHPQGVHRARHVHLSARRLDAAHDRTRQCRRRHRQPRHPGGTQSLHTNSFDEALGLPTEEAARIALRTQQVIGHESGVADFIDPLGGAWAVESLIAEIERRVGEYFAKIDELGGMVKAIELGFPQREIERRAYEHQRAVEHKERIVVGVNDFILAEEPPIPVATIDPALEADQVQRVQALRARRNAAEVARALTALDDAAAGTANLVTPILGAVKALATVGEIADVMRKRFGEYQPAR